MKRGQKKPSKPGAVEPPVSTGRPPDITVNHASRQPGPLAQAQLPIPQNPSVVEVLPSLKDTPLAERHALFIRKVRICCIPFDFSDTMKSAREKEIKRQTLTELVDLVQSGSCKMKEIMQEELIRMISFNLFRCLPPAPHENSGSDSGDPEEDEVFADPSWPHLQLVYELLLRYVVSSDMETRVAKRYLDHTFMLRLLDLFDSEDIREREYLKTILHRIYGRFMVHRPFIRNVINNIFYRFIFETERYNGEEHKLFLVRALIPLHKPKCVAAYHQQLTYCTVQFVEKDYRLAEVVIRGVLKYWPVTNCGKEVLFLGELEEILEVTHSVGFQRCIVPLFRQLSRVKVGSGFIMFGMRLCLVILLCLSAIFPHMLPNGLNEHIVGLIANNRHAILPIIFDSLDSNIRAHWNQAINGLSSNVRRMFLEMDSELFERGKRGQSLRIYSYLLFSGNKGKFEQNIDGYKVLR
ncbi:serine/threonine protein phosphatase 2Aregulatory subunit B, partial [Striga asiatica]